jgi:hypothetical protein
MQRLGGPESVAPSVSILSDVIVIPRDYCCDVLQHSGVYFVEVSGQFHAPFAVTLD